MRRPTSFATRLFLALFLLSALPALTLLGVATWGLRDYVQLTGDVDAWGEVTATGQELLTAVERAEADSAVERAAVAHERELSRSLRLARRLDLIASRLADALPWIALGLGLALAGTAFWAARSLARGLSWPVAELVDWADRLARAEPLPDPAEAEARGPAEFVALRHAFRHMADRLAEGRRQALEAERLRTWTEMARRVAHELKNPLTPLTLAVRQARRAAADDARELEEPLAVIATEAARLDEMARSFAQLGRTPDEPEIAVDLPELLEGLIASDVPPSVDRELAVEGDPERVSGGLESLGRAFRNLLGNAVAAVEEHPDPRIAVAVRAGNGTVEVTVADNGPGIPVEHRERIWEPDFTTRKRGTGLGLALVRQTIRAYGGEVELQETETGACFVVRLPTAGKATE